VARKDLPRSVDAYRLALQRQLGVRNGRLARDFESLYDLLHLSGYYRATIYRRKVVKAAIDDAERFVERLA
jgi:hypothetical protein